MVELTAMTSRDRVILLRTVEKEECYRLSPAQTRPFLTHQFDNPSLAYNMPSVYRTEGELDQEERNLLFERIEKILRIS